MSQLEKEQLSLDLIKDYVENRKIARMKSVFNVEAAVQIDKMFYMYNKKGWKLNSNQEIVFQDDEYIIVRAERGMTSGNYYESKLYHAAWVIGIDETGAWIHRLRWASIFEDDEYKYTKEWIKKEMGFVDSIKDDSTNFEINKAVRLQGDLTIVKIATAKDYIYEQELENRVYDEKNKLEKHMDDEIMKESEYKEIAAKYNKELKLIETLEGRREIRKKYNTKKRDLDTFLGELQGKEQNEYIYRREKELNLEQKKKELVESFKSDEMYKKQLSKMKSTQINYTVGNHLIIFSNARRLHNSWSLNEIIVSDESNLYVIHDEHQNKVIKLGEGVYSLRLLNRHQMG